jgi:hypothetical protein
MKCSALSPVVLVMLYCLIYADVSCVFPTPVQQEEDNIDIFKRYVAPILYAMFKDYVVIGLLSPTVRYALYVNLMRFADNLPKEEPSGLFNNSFFEKHIRGFDNSVVARKMQIIAEAIKSIADEITYENNNSYQNPTEYNKPNGENSSLKVNPLSVDKENDDTSFDVGATLKSVVEKLKKLREEIEKKFRE